MFKHLLYKWFKKSRIIKIKFKITWHWKFCFGERERDGQVKCVGGKISQAVLLQKGEKMVNEDSSNLSSRHSSMVSMAAACYRWGPRFKSRQVWEFINLWLKRKFNNSNSKTIIVWVYELTGLVKVAFTFNGTIACMTTMRCHHISCFSK